LLLDLKQLQKLTSSIVEKRLEASSLGTYNATIEKLESQVKTLTRWIWENNKYILPACENPGMHLAARPARYTFGSEEEMQLVLQYSWSAWEETPGAWDCLKQAAAETKP